MTKAIKKLKLNNPAKIMQTRDRLRRADLSIVNIDYLRQQINLLFKGFTHTRAYMAPNFGNLYRAIKYSVRPNDKYKLHYPPSNLAQLGRANLEGVSLFYGSGDPRATLYEARIKSGDTLILSKWEIKNEILIYPIGYTEEAFRKLQSDRKCPIIIPNDVKHPNVFRKSNLRIEEFFNEQFIQKVDSGKEYLYKITAIIAEILLKAQPDCGLAYPSTAMRANAENFVFTQPLVNQHLQCTSVKWYKAEETIDHNYILTVLAEANSFENDRINWKSVPQKQLLIKS